MFWDIVLTNLILLIHITTTEMSWIDSFFYSMFCNYFSFFPFQSHCCCFRCRPHYFCKWCYCYHVCYHLHCSTGECLKWCEMGVSHMWAHVSSIHRTIWHLTWTKMMLGWGKNTFWIYLNFHYLYRVEIVQT